MGLIDLLETPPIESIEPRASHYGAFLREHFNSVIGYIRHNMVKKYLSRPASIGQSNSIGHASKKYLFRSPSPEWDLTRYSSDDVYGIYSLNGTGYMVVRARSFPGKPGYRKYDHEKVIVLMNVSKEKTGETLDLIARGKFYNNTKTT